MILAEEDNNYTACDHKISPKGYGLFKLVKDNKFQVLYTSVAACGIKAHGPDFPLINAFFYSSGYSQGRIEVVRGL